MLSFTDEMHKTTSYKHLDYNREKTAAYFRRLIDGGKFVHLTDQCLMLGTIGRTFFGESVISSDVILYVKKEFRGEGHSAKAINEFIKWSDNNGAERISIGQSSGVCGEEFKAVAKSCGFKKLGEVFAR